MPFGEPAREAGMNYVMIICSDGIEASEPEERLVVDTIGEHIAQMADVEIYGHPLQPPATAKTVRVREGQTLVTDGPFVETKEHIGGFSLIDSPTRERAIEAAASHPLAWFNKLEVRPLAEEAGWTSEVVQRMENGPAPRMQRFMLLICSDGVPTEAKREAMQRELPVWVEQTTASGARVAGCRLAGPEAGVMVRVRGPHTLVSEEPFADAEEFLAGFDVIDCSGIDEAIEIAAAHPVSRFHAIEVRPFTLAMCGEEPSEEPLVAQGRSSAA